MILSTKMTARQYESLGQAPPGIRLELVHGEIAGSPFPDFIHGYTDRRLSQIILNHIDEHDLGELVGDIDTYFDDFNVRRPDIIFSAKARTRLRDPSKHGIRYAPDLCVEILSPGSATLDQTDKFDLYAKDGVAHYWIVDPQNQTFSAFQLSRGKYRKIASGTQADTVSADPFPNLKIPLSRLWPPSR
jgi:Uma2 family endonuclease